MAVPANKGIRVTGLTENNRDRLPALFENVTTLFAKCLRTAARARIK